MAGANNLIRDDPFPLDMRGSLLFPVSAVLQSPALYTENPPQTGGFPRHPSL
ncbi:hypothetical protein SACS_1413 [Parasaccharibacter apium]|uniref:Uncharacterized protein n=1 Tax=Parasaccharibacter apium TaxID=1510841 RepID=A0A7U7G6R5_9PROT|nr:hypothetical protein SACS_1413 [Parasaccharibacter apium]